MTEEAFVFESRNQRLLGILHRVGSGRGDLGVIVVVGGPQYRVGSHRQFVLLARELAAQSIPTLRFDYQGMGDSSGTPATFEDVEPDIRAAIDAFQFHHPGIRRVVLWGLCDGASAALMYAPGDPRVAGLVLLNPWVRSERGLAQSHLRTYYPRRLVSRIFWSKILRDPAAVRRAMKGLLQTLIRSRVGGSTRAPAGDFRTRMLQAFERFRGPVQLLLSGNDITAGEFRALVDETVAWQHLLGRSNVRRLELSGANHTFSSHEWRSWVVNRTVEAVSYMESRS